jgi:hypothetical protein
MVETSGGFVEEKVVVLCDHITKELDEVMESMLTKSDGEQIEALMLVLLKVPDQVQSWLRRSARTPLTGR